MANDNIKCVSESLLKISEQARKLYQMLFAFCYSDKLWDDAVYGSFEFYSKRLNYDLSSASFYVNKMEELESYAESFDCSADESAVKSIVSRL